jgi:formate hydrogenlyase transcriptional activator
VIAATNRDVRKAVTEGSFREDLFYRLNVFPIALPPLRERKGDIALLVKHFVTKHCRKLGKTICKVPQMALERLEAYSWPGNVRELESVIERAVIVSSGSTILPDELLDLAQIIEVPPTTLEEVERNHILKVLAETGWKIEGKQGAATRLGLNPSTLRSRLEKLAIQKPHKTN